MVCLISKSLAREFSLLTWDSTALCQATAAHTWSVAPFPLPAILNLDELLRRLTTTPIEASPPSRLELGPEDFAYLNAIDDIVQDMKPFQQIEVLARGCPDPDRYSGEDSKTR